MKGCSWLERPAGKSARGVPRREGPREGLGLLDFLRNTWGYAEALDCNVCMPLQKAANALYIHKVSPSATAEFEVKGRLSIRAVFKGVDQDHRTMLKARNVTFKQLRGTTLYERLEDFMAKKRAVLPRMDPKFRIP